ncbi:MAG: PAS domain-containing protein, partial [Myxococcota bacterium]|nr:PAS domain-containing protein [Myxococcota bacterium]
MAPRDLLLQMVKESREVLLEDWRRHASACFEDGGAAATTALLDHLEAQLADPGGASHAALDRFVLTCLDAGRDLSTTLQDLSAMRESVISLLLPRAPQAEAILWLRELHRALDGWVAHAAERYQHVRLRVLSCLDQLVASAGQVEDTDQLLQQLLKICAEEIPSLDVGAILLLEGGSVRARASCGLEVAAEQTLSLDTRDGLAGLLLTSTEPVHLVGEQILQVAVSPALRLAGLTALYGIRIANGGGPLGIAFMGSRTAPGFSPDQQVIFGMLAHKTSTLLQQALLRTQLEKAHGLVQAFMDYSPAGVFLKDLQHRYLLANRQMQELIAADQPGGPPPPVVGQTTRDLYPEAIADAVDRDDDRALASGKAVESEQLIRRGRDQRVFLVTKFPVRNAQG